MPRPQTLPPHVSGVDKLGNPIGKDPRTLGTAGLSALGHPPRSPAAAIRANCVECSGGSPKLANECSLVRCPLWPFRMGVSPYNSRTRAPGSPKMGGRAAQIED